MATRTTATARARVDEEAAATHPGNRESRLRVRVLPEEMRRWRGAARAQGGRSLSGWLRALADQAAACGEDPMAWRRDLAVLIRDLNSGVGNNLNQLNRTAARALTPETGERLADALALLAVELVALRGAVQAHLLRHGSPKRRGGGRRPRAGASAGRRARDGA